MTSISYWTDGQPGELVFKIARDALNHAEQMIETYGPRMTLGPITESPSDSKRRADGHLWGAGASSQSPRFLES